MPEAEVTLMAHNWLLYMAAFAIAFSVALLTTPFARKLAIKFHAVDFPRARGDVYKRQGL